MASRAVNKFLLRLWPGSGHGIVRSSRIFQSPHRDRSGRLSTERRHRADAGRRTGVLGTTRAQGRLAVPAGRHELRRDAGRGHVSRVAGKKPGCCPSMSRYWGRPRAGCAIGCPAAPSAAPRSRPASARSRCGSAAPDRRRGARGGWTTPMPPNSTTGAGWISGTRSSTWCSSAASMRGHCGTWHRWRAGWPEARSRRCRRARREAWMLGHAAGHERPRKRPRTRGWLAEKGMRGEGPGS